MSKASVVALALELSQGQGSPTNLDQLYDDIVVDVAQRSLFNVLETMPAVAGTATYQRPDRIAEVLGLFYDDTMLSLVTLRELEAVNPQWRDHAGRPVAYLIEDLSHETFQLYPVPVTGSTPVIPVHGAPFGLDYPSDTIVVLGSEKRQDMPEWMDLPLALLLLSREFGRPSQHTDKVFAGACRTLGALLMLMVA